VTLKGCLVQPNEFNDGDSFHVRHDGQVFIFRLYFVDAPETDDSVRERTGEQCRYFGVSAKQLRVSGEEAKTLTTELLKKPFTVTTRSRDAMGRSKLPRYYATVTVGGEDLATLLVSRGLARAKGTMANLPNGTPAKERVKHLKQLEAEAKAKQRGIWAHSTKEKQQSWLRKVRDWFGL
jgi:endonuclease YncB( thermonuclease family)